MAKISPRSEVPTELADLSGELERSFFAERVALSAGLTQQIRNALPRPTPVAARAFRALGVLMIVSVGMALLLLYQLYAMRKGGDAGLELTDGVRVCFWTVVGLMGCAGAWLSARIGNWLWIWRQRTRRQRPGTPAATVMGPLQSAVWVRVASFGLILASYAGLWRELAVTAIR